jgi:peptide/nickel transport system ATP-binding protein
VSTPIIQVKELRTYFNTAAGLARAVDGVSFDIKEGSTFALVGESGCGKSVTALSIIQLVPEPAGRIVGGEILLSGKNIINLPESEKREIRGNRISMVFQEPMTSLNPVFTAGNQIVEAITLHQKKSAAEAKKIAIDMLAKVGIPNPETRYDEYPHQLSGGMKQRVLIAIALSCKPDLLIADEPTTALDVTIQAQILDLMRGLQKDFGAAVLLITHDLGVVFKNADEVGVMYAGKIVEKASTKVLFRNPKHPYTLKLFRSIPSRQRRDSELETIEGTVPPATEFPEGCRFADRCPWVLPICWENEPALKEAEKDQFVACHLYDTTLVHEEDLQDKKLSEPAKTRPLYDKYRKEEAIINVKDLKTHYPIRKGVFKRVAGWVKAVDVIDMNLKIGSTLALVGESGCGKTTAGKSIIQLIPPTDGEVIFKEKALTDLSQRELRPYRNKLQIIFQDPYSSLNPRMMIGEILDEGLKIHSPDINKKERRNKAVQILEKVGLSQGATVLYPHEFSGGQRQRIAIARVLAVDPEFVVCDEAVSALDVSVQAQVLNLLKSLQIEYGLTYLFITHDLGVVEYIADEVAVMYLGRIVEQGLVDEIFDSPKHPYTQALLSAIPKIDDETGVKKIQLKGDVPSPINPPSGCHFHPRCQYRMEICDKEYPGTSIFSETHTCKCYLYDSDGNTVHGN